jgi:heme exporter protein A
MTSPAAEPGASDPRVSVADLRLVKISKTYGRHRALIDVSLTFTPGRVAALLGPNGAGKSTLLGILSTLVPPSQGEVLWGTDRLSRSSLLRARIGYVGHDPGVYADLTAAENLQLFCGLYGVANPVERSAALLTRVGLGDVRRDAAVRTFSRGMQQRLSLARALLAEPALLLFDEPASALDPAGAAWLTEEIERERRSGRIVVLVTHDLDAAAAVAAHVAVLRRGRLVAEREMDAPMSGAELRALYAESTRG